MSIKLCKGCKHMERGITSWFKKVEDIRCKRSDSEYVDKDSGIIIKRIVMLCCVFERRSSLDDCCGKEGQFFEARENNE